jgi:hypothetical protein
MGRIEIGGGLVYFVHCHNQSDEVQDLVGRAEDGGCLNKAPRTLLDEPTTRPAPRFWKNY